MDFIGTSGSSPTWIKVLTNRINGKNWIKMQMNIKILAFSIITTSLFGQSYESSYSGEQLELIEQMFNKECGGTKSYCDCIISAITTNISFKDLRNEVVR